MRSKLKRFEHVLGWGPVQEGPAPRIYIQRGKGPDPCTEWGGPCTGNSPSPWTDRMTDTIENIIFDTPLAGGKDVPL